MQISQLLVERANKTPDKSAIIFSGEKISFSTLKEKSFAVADFLKDKGAEKEDRVVFFLPNNPFFAYSLLGALSAGCSIVPLDFMLTEEEIINIINHCQAKFLFIKLKQNIEIKNIKDKCPSLVDVVRLDEKVSFLFEKNNLINKQDEDYFSKIDPDQLSSVFYTSGSTGHPKGVMLTFAHFNNPPEVIDYHLDLSENDINICAGLPFSHIGGFDAILLMLYYGSTLVLMERFQPLELLKNISQYKPTLMWLVPPMYIAILSLKDYSSFDLSSLRYVVVFGAPSSPLLMRKFRKICPKAKILNGWGMTETAAPNCVLPPEIEKIESIGKFTPTMEAKIVDRNQNQVGAGKEGHLWVKGKAVMKGYYKEPDLTNEVLTGDGWLKTGDLAKFDKDGLYHIVGRIKDMIKVAGEVVNSIEVEEIISRLPEVAEVAVVGVLDKLRGEVPKAFLVVKEGNQLSEEDLIQYLRNKIAHFKIPHYFEFIKQLPRNRAGKVNKKELNRRRTD